MPLLAATGDLGLGRIRLNLISVTLTVFIRPPAADVRVGIENLHVTGTTWRCESLTPDFRLHVYHKIK